MFYVQKRPAGNNPETGPWTRIKDGEGVVIGYEKLTDALEHRDREQHETQGFGLRVVDDNGCIHKYCFNPEHEHDD